MNIEFDIATDVKINASVVVVVGRHGPLAPAAAGDSGLPGHVRECPITVVSKEVISGQILDVAGIQQVRNGRSIDNVEIDVAVVVVIEPNAPAAAYFQDV